MRSYNVGCLADLVETAVQRNPRSEALHENGRWITYGELWDRVMRCANALVGLGLAKGDRLAVFAQNSSSYLETYLAAQRVGLIIVPVNFRLSRDELHFVLNDSGARGLFIGAQFLPLVHDQRAAVAIPDERIVVLSDASGTGSYDALIERSDATPVPFQASPLDPAAIFYTSGTTGFPKGAVLSHHAILTRFSSWGWRFGITEEETTFVPGPIFHQSFGSVALVTLAVGGRVVLRPEFRPQEAIEDLSRFGVTWTFLVPTMISGILDGLAGGVPLGDMARLRGVMSSGSRLPTPLIEGFEATFPHASLSDAYGWTESGWITYCRHADMLRTDRSLGQASFGCAIAILDEAGNMVAPGEAGQVYACNPVPFLGYHDNPEATAEMRRGRWETGGDVGYIDEEGFLHLLDRKRDLIISGGENIYPAEIERVLIEHPKILDVAVVGVQDPKWGEHPRACVVLRDGETIDADELRQFCLGKLSNYKIPKSIHKTEALPRNSMGKVLRRALREKFWEEHHETYEDAT